MSRLALRVLFALEIFALAHSAALAQNVNASLNGRVVDQSSGLVTGAELRLTSRETSITLSTNSGSSGLYSFPNVPPGNYELKVSAAGFRDFIQTGIRAALGDRLRVDIELTVGTPNQTVEVRADASPLNYDNAAQGGNVSPETVQGLPLLVAGGPRSSAAFISLLPGVSSPDGNVVGAHMNGSVQGGGEALLNGVSMVNPSGGNGVWSASFDFPQSPDMVSEIRVLNSNYEPQYGSTGGAVFIMETKAGTNQFHGGLYEYHRNTALNARQFGAESRPKDLENDFGGSIGGPVKLPLAWTSKNKTYFFVNVERFRIRGGILRNTLSIPSMKERQGDFTDWIDPSSGQLIPIYDPATTRIVNGEVVRQQFMGCDGLHPNVICSTDPRLQNSLANGWLKFLPEPTFPGALNNYQPPAVPAYISSDANFLNLRFDEYIGNNDHITVTLFRRHNLPQRTHQLPVQLTTDLENYKYTWLNRVNYDHIFTPTLLNHFGIGYTNDQFYGGGQDAPFAQDLPQIAGTATRDYAPSLTFNGEFANFGSNTGSAKDNKWPAPAIVGNDLVTWVNGKHIFKFGVEYRYMTNTFHSVAGEAGQFGFTRGATGLLGVNSGSPIASFLLGAVDTASLTLRSINVASAIQRSWILHAGDTWKVTPKLTVNYGLRWEMFTPTSEKHDVASFFDPSRPNPEAGNLPGSLVFAGSRWGDASLGKRHPEDTFHNGFGPRLGIAYSPAAKTVIRTGYGVFFDAGYYPGWMGGIAQDGFNFSPSYGSGLGGLDPAFYLNQGFPQGFAQPPLLDPGLLNGQSGPLYRPRDANRLPYSQQWNFTIERQVGESLTVSAAYVGSKGTRLLSRTAPLNALNPALLKQYGAALYDQFEPGQTTLDGVSIPYAGWVEQMQACPPSVAQALLPFPQYCGALQGLNENAGNSTYHSLQLKAEKRLANGLWFLGSYTFAKLITNADNNQPDSVQGGLGIISPFERRRTKGLALEDIPHTFSFAVTYDLPFGKNKRWLNSSALLNHIAGGWTVSSILRLNSGTPFFFRSSTCNVPSEFRVACIPGIQPGANVWAQDKSNFDPTKPLFNVNAFEPADSFNFYYGSGPRITNLRGFGYHNQDLLLSKSIPITERVALQLRGEAFNVWNTHIFRGFNNDIASPNFGMWNGLISAPRNIQIGARITF